MMSESNTEGMMNPEPERGERMGVRMKTLGEIHSRLEKLKQKRKKLDALGWDDIGQEVVGAATVAVITYFSLLKASPFRAGMK
ncbi:hypothetical protein [Thermococcus sp.]|uniref:hypothetical protein n=1 Tax=Thermococcus sp. TaxID=35749 RepID=UPI002630B6F9|nr:hypothetical protein [Thermococcus sp.]